MDDSGRLGKTFGRSEFFLLWSCAPSSQHIEDSRSQRLILAPCYVPVCILLIFVPCLCCLKLYQHKWQLALVKDERPRSDPLWTSHVISNSFVTVIGGVKHRVRACEMDVIEYLPVDCNAAHVNI